MSTSRLIRPGGRSRSGRLVALLIVTAVAASLLSAPASPAVAATDPAPATGPGAALGMLPGNAERVAVTLITGDIVWWQDTGDGNPRVEVEPAPRDYPVEFDQSGTQQDFYVIPTDAMAHVVAGTLDRELFNVPGLIRQGLADAATDELPVIVTFNQDRSTPQLTRDADALPATSNPTALERVNGAGVTVNRDRAGAFRQAVLGTPPPNAARTTSADMLDGAVEQIMLDRVLRIDLADSVPQIGAPQAWDAGYTGEGVTVAVLDTGIDADHPDLAGQVVAEQNFTDEPDATDTHGHGTHVASTIAGTGAASDGTRTGVAPDADLLNGKVCVPTPDGQGACQTSWIMAGMEWATQQGADIVNMSLSGGPTDGTDPLSQLLNQLSAETDTLFVTSAGNSGCCQQVGSPGAADAALAVGVVSKSDILPPWSSRGPRLGDHAVKPEITAPGVGIIAARAAGTNAGNPVGDHHTSLSGTSMAAPHVAGAAALLAQAHPELDWAQTKDTLVSTATDLGRRWYEQGLGRVDVPAALNSPVHATGTVNLGHLTDQASQDITYTNHSDTAITLDLDAAITDTSGQAIDVATLSTDTLTVPARGQATATITVDITSVPDRDNLLGGGAVTATADGVSLRTGIGFGPVRHVVTIEVLDSHGNLIGTTTAAEDRPVDLDHDTYDPASPVGKLDYTFSTREGVATGHVPTGSYTLKTVVRENHPVTGEPLRGSVVVAVDVAIDSDTTITLDARNAVPIRVTVPRPVDQRNHQVSLLRQRANINPGTVNTLRVGGATVPMYATPAPPSQFGFLALWVHWVLAEPQPVRPLPWGGSPCNDPDPELRDPAFCYSEAPAYAYHLPFLYDDGIPGNLHETVTRGDLVEVPSRFHADQPDDVFINHQFEAFPPFPFFGAGQDHRMWIKPGEVTEYFLADDRFTWVRNAFPNHSPEGTRPSEFGEVSSDWFPATEAGTRRAEERWGEAPLRVGAVDVREEFLGNPIGVERFATASRGGMNGDQFIPGYQIMGPARGHFTDVHSGLPSFASWRMWNLDTGAELEGVEYDPGNYPGVSAFTLASEEATYRLEQVDEYPEQVTNLFRTGPATTTWTFSSRPSETLMPIGYTCPHPVVDESRLDCQVQPLIQLEYRFGLDLHNRVRAGRAHVFTIMAGHHSHAADRARVASLRVQASFDDGNTWQDARILGSPRDSFDTGGLLPSSAPYQEFRASLRQPRLADTSGFVTLRVQATDTNGGTIEQIVHRAYLLK